MLTLVPGAAVAWLGAAQLSSYAFELAVGKLTADLSLVSGEIRRWLVRATIDVRQTTQADVLETTDAEAMAAYFNELLVENPNLHHIAVLGLDGAMLAYSQGETEDQSMDDWIIASVADPAFARLFEQARTGQQGDVFTTAPRWIGTGPGIVLVAPVTDERNLQVVKILIVSYALEELRSVLLGLTDTDPLDAQLYLAYGRDLVVLSSDPAQPDHEPMHDPGLSTALQQQGVEGLIPITYQTSEGTERLALYRVFDAGIDQSAMRWTLIGTASGEAIAAPTAGYRNMILMVAALLLGVALVVGVLAAHTTIRPLRRLLSLVGQAGSGPVTGFDAIEGPTEVEALAQAFDTTIRQVRERDAQIQMAQRIANIGLWVWYGADLTNWSFAPTDRRRPYLSQQVRDIFGLTDPDQAIQTWVEPPVEHANTKEVFREAERQMQPYRHEFRLIGPGGKVKTVVECGEPQLSGDGTIWVGIIQDVTEQRAIEAQLQQSQRMEAVGQLTGGIAHDFNNLLAVIIGSLELLLEERPHELGRAALRAAERGAALTHKLLAFSRQQLLRPTVSDLNKIIGNMDELLRRTLGEQIEIRLVAGAGLWLCDVDAHELESALLNLAINARDAMPNGGKLTIETANVCVDDEDAAAQTDLPPGQYVMVAVTDTGTGIPEDLRDKVFEPFFTTKEHGKGTGLGLAMVFGFVKQSNGHIKVYSETARGTTFKIFLPRSGAEGAERTSDSDPAEVPGGRGEHIMVVEDDPDVRALAVLLLTGLGYDVAESVDGHGALETFSLDTPVDLLLTDVMLPGKMTGPQLVAALRKIKPDLRVLYMSGYTANAMLHDGRLEKDDEMVAKPFHRAELARAVRKAMKR